MSWKEEMKKIMDGMTERYNTFKNFKYNFISDLKDVFQYAAYSAGRVGNTDSTDNTLANGHFMKYSYWDDSSVKKNNLMQDIYAIRKDVDTLEKIVSGSILDPERLSGIITLKNAYFWKSGQQLQDIIKEKTGIVVTDVNSLIREAMVLKVNNPRYHGITSIYYDSNIASSEMKEEFIHAYVSSDKTLKEISVDLEKRYGMHISASTISVHARKHFENKGVYLKNRREAKKRYQAKVS
ncbi:MAG: hypothetical protein ACP5NW_04605 [Candidatus Woesearchaeota archaeon]